MLWRCRLDPKLGALRMELDAAGVFEHCELRSWGKLAVLVSTIAAGLTVIALVGWWLAFFVVPVLSVFATATAMLGHEGSHRSFSSSPVRNAIVAYFAFPLFGGLSTLYWHEKHDRLHHGHPNVEGVDPDIKPFPFVSSRGDHEKCGPKSRWFQRTLQRPLFWPMATLMTLGMRRSSIVHLMAYPKRNGGRDRAWWIELACLTAHYLGWLVIPSLIWGPLATFTLYFAMWGGVGVALALVFAPAHMAYRSPTVSRMTGSTSWRPRGASSCRASSRTSSSASTTRSSTTCSPRSRTRTCRSPPRSPRRGACARASRT